MSDFKDIEDLKEENFDDVDLDEEAYENEYNDTFDDALDDTYDEPFDDEFDDLDADGAYDDEFDEKPAAKKPSGRSSKKSGKAVKSRRSTTRKEESNDFDDADEFEDEYFDDQAYDEEEETQSVRRRQEPRRRSASLKKTSSVDDFREWLSDNLRYFMLGGIVLLIVLVIIFAVRGCKGKDPSADIETGTESTTTVEEPAETEPAEEVIANPLGTAETGIVSLINERFTALAAGDLEGVRAVQTDLSAVDEARITADSAVIDSYTTKNVYTKAGMADGEYVTYVEYEANYTGYGTPVPMLDELYVITGGSGFLVDSDAKTNPDKSAYMEQLKQDSDLRKLISDVQAAHNSALASDPDLSSFLSGMGEEVQPSESAGGNTSGETVDGVAPGESAPADGTTMTATTDVNVRSLPGGDESEIIGGISYGESVTVLGTAGENGDWYEVQYGGMTGYVYSEYLTDAY